MAPPPNPSMSSTSRLLRLAAVPLLAGWLAAQDPVVDRGRLDVARSEGRDRVVLKAADALVAAGKADIEVLGAAVDAAENIGDYAAARTWIKRWADAAPSDPLPVIRAAELALRLADPDGAETLILPLTATLDPVPADRPAVRFRAVAALGRAHLVRGRDATAERLFDRLVEEAKRVVVTAPDDLVALADAYVFFGGMKEAEKALVDAQKAAPSDPRPSIALGFHYARRMYLPADAVAEFNAALKIRPNSGDALFGLAETLDGWMTAENHAKRSREALEKLADINPLHVEAGVWTARDAMTNFRIPEGLKTLDRIATVAPKHPGVLTLRAVATYLTEGEGALTTAFAPVFAVDPTYGEAYRVLADVLNQRRRWPESLRFAEEAAKKDPEDPRIRDDVARYALFLGEGDKGLAALKAADERDAFGQPWRINMRKLLAKMSKSFTTVKAGRFDVRLPVNEADLLSRVYGPFIERSYGILRAKYGVDPDGVATTRDRMLLEIFTSHADFSVRTLGFNGLGALGVCFGPFLAVDAPQAAPEGEIGWARVFHHELAHSMTLALSKGRVPRWLTEGLSTYEEVCFNTSWVRPMHRELFDAWKGNDLLAISTFDAAFGTSRIGFAYFQGGLVAGWLVDRFGMPKMVELLRTLAEDVPPNAAIARVFGVEPSRLDEDFAEHVGRMVGGWKLTAIPSRARAERLSTEAKEGKATLAGLIDLGNFALATGNPVEAEARLVAARAMDADAASVRWLDARLAAALGRSDRAKDIMKRLADEGFEDFDLFMALGEKAEKDGEGGKALDWYTRAIAAFPKAADGRSPRLRAARLLRGEGRRDEAQALVEAHLECAPEDMKARASAIEAARAAGDKRRLLHHLENGIMVDPTQAEWHLERARLAKESGDVAKAVEAAGCASAALPPGKERTAAFVFEAECLVASGDPRTALLRIEKALSETPDDAAARALKERLSATGDPPK